MVAKKNDSASKGRKPATTVESRENQMIALAVDLAEKQLNAGTASSQVMTHFLKLGSTKEQLEKDKLKTENELLKAKIDSLRSAKTMEELYSQALTAMKSYNGQGENNDSSED